MCFGAATEAAVEPYLIFVDACGSLPLSVDLTVKHQRVMNRTKHSSSLLCINWLLILCTSLLTESELALLTLILVENSNKENQVKLEIEIS